MNNIHNDAVRIGFAVMEISDCLLSAKPVITPLQLVACYLENPHVCTVWLCLDLMDIDKSSIDYFKKHSGFKKGNIHILSTHNHGGGEIDDYELQKLGKITAKCIRSAQDNARTAYMSYAEICIEEQLNYLRRFYSDELKSKTTVFWGPCPDNEYDSSGYIASNINNIRKGEACYSGEVKSNAPNAKLSPGDSRLQILFFEEENGNPIGSICRFAAHAVCCNSPEYYSSDYPYYVRKTLEEKIGGISLFLNGPCAEIAPGILNKHSGGEKELGQKLGQKAASIINRIKREKVNYIADYSLDVELPLRKEMFCENFDKEMLDLDNKLKNKDNISLPELRKIAERKRLIETLDFLHSKATGGNKQTVTLGKLVINDITILGLPGEIFSSSTEKAIKLSNREKIIAVTEHDGTAMYIVPEAEYDSGGYENTCCMVSKDAEKILIKEIEKFITK